MKQFGRYQVIKQLAAGGMGGVLLAYDPHLRREVAVKVVNPDSDNKYRELFSHEMQIMARLAHPAIMPIYDFGEQDGQLFFVMPFMQGRSLAERLKQGPFSLEEAVQLFEQLGRGLEMAHAQGVVHCDLKPSNILLDSQGFPYLIDFGLAKLLDTSMSWEHPDMIAGTPAYMSPEQFLGRENIDQRTDIYALGVIFFELLTGRRPYQSNKRFGFGNIQPILNICTLNPNLPPECQKIIEQALAKRPDDRYPTVSKMLADLKMQLRKYLSDANFSYQVQLSLAAETVPIGGELKVTVELQPAGFASGMGYLLKMPRFELNGSELNLLLDASGFQFLQDPVASLPFIGPARDQVPQRATFRLVARRPGLAQINLSLYCGSEYEGQIKQQVRVVGISEQTTINDSLTLSPRPVAQPDYILQIDTDWNESGSTYSFHYHLTSTGSSLMPASQVSADSGQLSAVKIKRLQNLWQEVLSKVQGGIAADVRSCLAASGRYLYQTLLPEALRQELRVLGEVGGTLLLVADQDAWLPWELVHDGHRFLAEHFIIGRWLRELPDVPPYEIPVGQVNVAYYANVSAPEQWATLIEPLGSPPAKLLSEEGLASLGMSHKRPLMLEEQQASLGVSDERPLMLEEQQASLGVSDERPLMLEEQQASLGANDERPPMLEEGRASLGTSDERHLMLEEQQTSLGVSDNPTLIFENRYQNFSDEDETVVLWKDNELTILEPIKLTPDAPISLDDASPTHSDRYLSLPTKALPTSVSESIRGLHLLRYGEKMVEQESSFDKLRNQLPVLLADADKEQTIEGQIQPIKLNLHRNHPLVSLSYVSSGQPHLTNLIEQWAPTFVRAGCSAFVGPLWTVSPAVEAAFISGFYHHLWTGGSLGEAFEAGRALARATNPESLDWLAYVLFGDPMARPYRPVKGPGYAVLEVIGQSVDEPLRAGILYRCRVSLRRTPPVWLKERVIEVEEALDYQQARVHLVAFDLQVEPNGPLELLRTPQGDYLGWFSMVAAPDRVGESVELQVHFADGREPIQSLMLSFDVINQIKESE